MRGRTRERGVRGDRARAVLDEMDRLDGQLAARPVREAVGCTIRTENAARADAIARRHGYGLELRPVDEPGCSWAVFHPVEDLVGR